MLWIVQNNLQCEPAYKDFIGALKRLDLDYLIVKPVPFTDKLLPADFDSMTQEVDDTPEPEIDAKRKIIISGSITLSKMARRRGWSPGTLYNSNFEWKYWRDGFGRCHTLNSDAYTGLLGDIELPNSDYFFIRPVHDDKKFAGKAISRYEFEEWRQRISFGNPEFEYVPVLIASPKKILTEHRFFVVDKKIVTGSLYKRGTKVVHDRNVCPDAQKYAEGVIQWWQPAPAFVIDIALTSKTYGYCHSIIEINNICSAGFYAADVQKIIMALEEYYE